MTDGPTRQTEHTDAQRIPSGLYGDALLTTKQAAEALAISPRKMWELASIGAIPTVKIGSRNIRFDPIDLRKAIQKMKRRRR